MKEGGGGGGNEHLLQEKNRRSLRTNENIRIYSISKEPLLVHKDADLQGNRMDNRRASSIRISNLVAARRTRPRASKQPPLAELVPCRNESELTKGVYLHVPRQGRGPRGGQQSAAAVALKRPADAVGRPRGGVSCTPSGSCVGPLCVGCAREAQHGHVTRLAAQQPGVLGGGFARAFGARLVPGCREEARVACAQLRASDACDRGWLGGRERSGLRQVSLPPPPRPGIS